MCGKKAHEFTPGSGEVIVRLEQLSFTPELQDAMHAPAVAEYKADAAKHTAVRTAREVGGPIRLMMEEWVAGELAQLPRDAKPEAVAAFVRELKDSGRFDAQMRLYKDLILSKQGSLKVDRFEPSNTDGSPLKGNLGVASAMAYLFGDRGRAGPGKPREQ